jgi:hypothetical protein
VSRRVWRSVVLSLVALALVVPITTAASRVTDREWHRNNYGAGHERLSCFERPPAWTCAYSTNDLEPVSGWFYGQNVTASWTCPDWFASEVCDPVSLVAVYRGATLYGSLSDEDEQSVIRQDYILTNVNGQEILYLYWRESPFFGAFYCPWFRTFEEALGAPFECVFHDA